MRKTVLLNSGISSVVSCMGHTDMLTIGDCGLPIPQNVQRIDLALKLGVPSFLETLDTVLEELCVEKIILAEEIKTQNPKVLGEIEALFAGQNIAVEYVSHVELKALTGSCKAVIRTGETTPYANIVLQSGCIFA
jgi:D-ribose pyranase